MSSDATPCRLCGNLIIFSENNVSRNGIPIPMNFSNNKFGGKGTNHNCRPKYDAPDPSKIDMHVFCPNCLTYHNRRIYPWCPCCFKLLCTNCKNKWVPNIFNHKDVDYEGELYWECIECGSMDIELIEDTESWENGWKRRQEIVDNLKCTRCKGKNWIHPSPAYYKRSTNSMVVSYIPGTLPYDNWWKTPQRS